MLIVIMIHNYIIVLNVMKSSMKDVLLVKNLPAYNVKTAT